jgi:hypothetical protein
MVFLSWSLLYILLRFTLHHHLMPNIMFVSIIASLTPKLSHSNRRRSKWLIAAHQGSRALFCSTRLPFPREQRESACIYVLNPVLYATPDPVLPDPDPVRRAAGSAREKIGLVRERAADRKAHPYALIQPIEIKPIAFSDRQPCSLGLWLSRILSRCTVGRWPVNGWNESIGCVLVLGHHVLFHRNRDILMGAGLFGDKWIGGNYCNNGILDSDIRG